MGDRFRSMIESEFAEVDSPPIGDLVDNAIRDGRRLRRTQVVQRSVACFAAVGVLALGVGMATSTLRPGGSPGSDDGVAAPPAARPAATAPYVSAEPTVDRSGRRSQMPPDTPTMAVFPDGGPDGAASQPPTAPPAAVLLALGSTLPTGATIAFAGSRFDTFTGVQVFLDRGAGFGMIRVAMARYGPRPGPFCNAGTPGVAVSCADQKGALVETFEIESNCVQRRGVNVYRPDGIAIQVNIGSCLAEGDWGAAATKAAVDDEVLAVAEAIQIGLSPVWDERMMIETAAKAEDLYPKLPLLISFDGVGP
jgi:hypothetical protein